MTDPIVIFHDKCPDGIAAAALLFGEHKQLHPGFFAGTAAILLAAEQIGAASRCLDLTVDYGWLWFIAQPLHWLLTVFHGFVQNWGVAIIMLTLLVRGIMFPVTKAQYTSMAKMRMLQPKLQEKLGGTFVVENLDFNAR